MLDMFGRNLECAPRTGQDEQAELTWKPGFRRMEGDLSHA